LAPLVTLAHLALKAHRDLQVLLVFQAWRDLKAHKEYKGLMDPKAYKEILDPQDGIRRALRAGTEVSDPMEYLSMVRRAPKVVLVPQAVLVPRVLVSRALQE
jgi:hypothetical protein